MENLIKKDPRLSFQMIGPTLGLTLPSKQEVFQSCLVLRPSTVYTSGLICINFSSDNICSIFFSFSDENLGLDWIYDQKSRAEQELPFY